MTILFSASEVGSARALAPVCESLRARGHALAIDRCGFFTEARFPSLTDFFVTPDTHQTMSDYLQQQAVSCLVFSVNIHDPRPLRIARAAQKAGIPTLHVLDYWNGYSERMQLDGKSPFQPDHYLVPDDYAAEQAHQHGIKEHIITVTGQPALAETLDAFHEAAARPCPLDTLPRTDHRLIVFASEPVAYDQGHSAEQNPAFRGYTETDALAILQQALAQSPQALSVAILPHPRQEDDALSTLWSSLGGEPFGKVINDIRGRDLLPFATGIAGMASTLLYEAWLLGKPVLSIQPGLRNDSLRMLQNKSGVTFIDQYETARDNTIKWLSRLPGSPRLSVREDLERHAHAPLAIANMAMAATS